jgi:hypothetical protein
LILAAEAPRLEMVLCYELQTQLIWTLWLLPIPKWSVQSEYCAF